MSAPGRAGMSFVQRGVDMVNERFNRGSSRSSPEKPPPIPAEAPHAINGGHSAVPSVPATSSSLLATGDGLPDATRTAWAPSAPAAPPCAALPPLKAAAFGAPPGSSSMPLAIQPPPLVGVDLEPNGPTYHTTADEIHGLDDMLWLLREPGEVGPSPMEEEDDDWVSSIASSVASYDRSADEALGPGITAELGASTIEGSAHHGAAGHHLAAASGVRPRPPSASGGPPPRAAPRVGHVRSISEPVSSTTSTLEFGSFGPSNLPSRQSSAEALLPAGAMGGADYPSAGANEITTALWALTRRYETYYDAGPGSPMKAQRIEQRRLQRQPGAPALTPLELGGAVTGAPPPSVVSEPSSAASAGASSVASAATAGAPGASPTYAHAAVAAAPQQPAMPPPAAPAQQQHPAGLDYEFEPPPRYRDWRPNRAGFHAARAEWFRRQTGRELTGTVAQQDRAVNAWARRYRGKTHRGGAQPAAALPGFGAAIGAR